MAVTRLTSWRDLTDAQKAAGTEAQYLVLAVVSDLAPADRRVGTKVTRAIASSPNLKAAYQEALGRHDDLLATALSAVAAGVIRRFIEPEMATFSASVLGVPLASESAKTGGDWPQAILDTMGRLGAFSKR